MLYRTELGARGQQRQTRQDGFQDSTIARPNPERHGLAGVRTFGFGYYTARYSGGAETIVELAQGGLICDLERNGIGIFGEIAGRTETRGVDQICGLYAEREVGADDAVVGEIRRLTVNVTWSSRRRVAVARFGLFASAIYAFRFRCQVPVGSRLCFTSTPWGTTTRRVVWVAVLDHRGSCCATLERGWLTRGRLGQLPMFPWVQILDRRRQFTKTRKLCQACCGFSCDMSTEWLFANRDAIDLDDVPILESVGANAVGTENVSAAQDNFDDALLPELVASHNVDHGEP